MRWKTVMLFVLLLGMTALAELPKFDVATDGRMIVPRKNELYNHTFGTNAMLRYWLNDEMGVGLSLGYEAWRFDDDKTHMGPVSLEIGGVTNAFPIGLHGVWRFESGKPFEITDFITGEKRTGAFKKAKWSISAGVVYMAMDDSAEVVAKGPGGQMAWDLSTDETWLIRVEIAYEDKLPILNIPVIVGLGYQRDVSRGDVNVKGLDITETNDMTGGLLKVGFPFIF